MLPFAAVLSVEPPNAAPAVAEPVAATQWQYRGDEGWVDFDSDSCATLSTVVGETQLVIGDRVYSVDAERTFQTNPVTGYRRAIRRAPSAPASARAPVRTGQEAWEWPGRQIGGDSRSAPSTMAIKIDEKDLRAYDAILAGASRLTFRLVKDRKLAFTTFRVDADGTKDAFSILVNHRRGAEHLGKPYRELEFYADIALGDGSDGRVVQTVCREICCVPMESMDRGDKLVVSWGHAGSLFDLLCKCQAHEHELKMERASGSGVRLAFTAARNVATCRRSCFDCLCAIPTFFSGPVCVSMCVAPPARYYELQDASDQPLGSALFTRKSYTCCYVCCCYAACEEGQPHGSFVDFGTAPLQARRDVVAGLAAWIGNVSAMPPPSA